MDYRDIAKYEHREKLAADYGRLLVPAIILGKKVFWGFEQNKEEISRQLDLK